MTSQLTLQSGVLMILIGALVSCSAGGSAGSQNYQPIAPNLVEESAFDSNSGARYLWAYYEVHVDPKETKVDIVPVRHATQHWNVLGWLEQWPCTDCVAIVGIADSGYGTKLVDVEITHPFLNQNLTGFDVRGIAMFDGSFNFPSADVTAPDRYAGDGELINADGYTALYNSGTEGSGPDGLQGYMKGGFATAQAPNAEANGFKCYSSSDSANTRNAFYAGDSVTQTFDIDMPDGSFVFGYAVDANWAPPTTKPVTDPMTHFPPEANCPEPWKIVVTQEPIGLGLTETGGKVVLTFDIYDHQGNCSYTSPLFEMPEMFVGAHKPAWVLDGPGYSRYQSTLYNSYGAPAGRYRGFMRVVDNENSSAPAWLDLTGYQVFMVEVSEYEQNGWAGTWGGPDWDGGGYEVAVDIDGNAYVTGEFQGTVDFDPGDETDERTAVGGRDAFLSKFNSDGSLQWALTWGGSGYDYCYGIALDSSGYVYVTGGFSDTADLDPGPGVSNFSVMGATDGYMTKFSPEGEFIWVDVWGTFEVDWGRDIICDGSTFVYLTGISEGDVFLRQYTPDHVLNWICTWGGPVSQFATGVAVDYHGDIYVSGNYQGTVDFDPGTGDDSHTSAGSIDCYLTKFDPTGEHEWAITWGGSGLDSAEDVAQHGNTTLIVVGRFSGTVDFDPSIQVELRDSNGGEDAFMSKFNDIGQLSWVYTWGGSGGGAEWDRARSVAVDDVMNIYVTGEYGDTVDFDPGAELVLGVANGMTDVYVSKFNISAHFQWVSTWGGTGQDTGLSTAVNTYNDVFVTGAFYDTVDFDPGFGGTDEHASNGDRDIFLCRLNAEGQW